MSKPKEQPTHQQTANKAKTVRITFKAVDQNGKTFQDIDYAIYNKKVKAHDAMLRITKDSTVTVDLIPGEVYKVRFGQTLREITVPNKSTTIIFVVTDK
jgi:hypothetical protein